MIRFSLFTALFMLFQCQSQITIENKEDKKIRQEKIIKEHLENGAWNYMMFSKEWQDNIDAGLEKDSTIGLLWQQKAMPYFKLRKYEIGMPLIDKAVLHEPMNYLDYRAFIKCIFAKSYKEAILDFEKCIQLKGNQYVQDHSYAFYIGISKLQLNEFEKAEKIFQKDIALQTERMGDAHFLDLFYYGISIYEQQRYHEAITVFNKVLEQYPEFSDLKFYKAICLMNIGKEKEGALLIEEGKKNADQGYTITEDNAVYENYPYQVIWR